MKMKKIVSNVAATLGLVIASIVITKPADAQTPLHCPTPPNNLGCAVANCAIVRFGPEAGNWALDTAVPYSSCALGGGFGSTCVDGSSLVCAMRRIYSGQTLCQQANTEPVATYELTVTGCDGTPNNPTVPNWDPAWGLN
jgi:hypothetical protein